MRDVLEDVVVFLDGRVVDRHARIVDDLVGDAVGVGLRGPAEIIDRLRPVALSTGIDLVDRADLARLRLGDQVAVLEAPPRRGVAAERSARVGRVGAGAGLHVHDAHLEDVAGLGAADVDRARADVHAKAFAGAASQKLAVDRSGAAAVHALLLSLVHKNTLSAPGSPFPPPLRRFFRRTIRR